MTKPRLPALVFAACAATVVGFACLPVAPSCVQETSVASRPTLAVPSAAASVETAPPVTEVTEPPAPPPAPSKAKPTPRRPLHSRYTPWLT